MAASLAKSVVSGEFAEVLTAVQLAQKLMAGKGKGGSKEAKRQVRPVHSSGARPPARP